MLNTIGQRKEKGEKVEIEPVGVHYDFAVEE
jgi:hypothetical protein